jgi:hypothetical protein
MVVDDFLEDIVSQSCFGGGSMLITVDSDSIHDFLPKLIVALQEKRSIIYLSLNRPFSTLKRIFEKNGCRTDRIYFLDCVTQMGHKMYNPQYERVIFAESPQDIGEGGKIPEGIKKHLMNVSGKKFIIMDALRTLTIYSDEVTVVRFIENVLGFSKMLDARIIALTHDGDERLIQMLSDRFDNIARV